MLKHSTQGPGSNYNDQKYRKRKSSFQNNTKRRERNILYFIIFAGSILLFKMLRYLSSSKFESQGKETSFHKDTIEYQETPLEKNKLVDETMKDGHRDFSETSNWMDTQSITTPAPNVRDINNLIDPSGKDSSISESKLLPVPISRGDPFEKQGKKKETISTITSGSKSTQSPAIAWLMSFPNSGTSYTLSVVRRASLQTTATNYGREKMYDGASVSLYPEYDQNGPFLHKLDFTIPDQYILTKTHCGGFCSHCSPNAYIISKRNFQKACLSGKSEDENANRELVTYEVELVEKVVYLLRNPFDNIVSRFHLTHNEYTRSGNQGNEEAKMWLKQHPRNEEGFREWCKDTDIKYNAEEIAHIPELSDFPNMLCRSEFVKYIQWHNLAAEVVKDNEIPSHVIYYEDYQTKFNETLDTLLLFLEMPKVGDLKEFHLSNYSTYFTDIQRAQSTLLMQTMASGLTRQKILRYVDFP